MEFTPLEWARAELDHTELCIRAVQIKIDRARQNFFVPGVGTKRMYGNQKLAMHKKIRGLEEQEFLLCKQFENCLQRLAKLTPNT